MNDIPQSFEERYKRFLGLMAIIIAVATLLLAYWIVDVVDAMKIDPPKWLAYVLGFGFLILVFCEFFAVVWGLGDVVHQFLPEGRFKKSLIQASRPKFEASEGKQMTPEEMGGAAFALATAPLYVLLGLAVIGLVILLAVGGAAVVGALLEKFLAGWPPWAIVICILLVAILFKEDRARR